MVLDYGVIRRLQKWNVKNAIVTYVMPFSEI